MSRSSGSPAISTINGFVVLVVISRNSHWFTISSGRSSADRVTPGVATKSMSVSASASFDDSAVASSVKSFTWPSRGSR